MRNKFRWMMCLALLLSLPFAFAAVPAAALACNPAFVTQAGNVITVKATAVDDTVNLQCAFDLAVAAGPGMTVRLLKGTYQTAQLVVNDFQGKFKGAGLDDTVVTNLPNLYVTPEDVIFNPPSAANPWPTLLSFLESDFSLSDMAIQITGDQPTLGWTIFGIDPPLRELSSAVLIMGDFGSARIERVLVEGQLVADSLFGYNLINGIIYENYYSAQTMWITGSYTVQDSILRTLASGTPLVGVSGAAILITRNTFENVIWGMDGGDFLNSRFEFSYNHVNAAVGLDLYNGYENPEDSGTAFLVKNNIFRGGMGPAFEQNFGTGNKCLFIGNNVQAVADVGIYLGPGTIGCTVVGGAKNNVLDLGTDNILVGVNNMGTGVGPTIHTLIRLFR